MQHELTQQQELLTTDGTLQEQGWARHPLWRYRRDRISASWLRIKEWDYYYICLPEEGLFLTVTVSDLGYAGLIAVCLVNLVEHTYHQIDSFVPFTRGTLQLAPSSREGIVHYNDKKMGITISSQESRRYMSITVPSFPTKAGFLPLTADLTVEQHPNDESMNIATSWKENPKAFYLNEKVTCMAVKGTISLGNREISCRKETDTAGLDWGRGRWTYSNRWYWASASSHVDGLPFGLNLGYGFSDRTPASENALFYDHTIHKLDKVTWSYSTENYLEPWRFTDNEKRLNLSFEPVVDRHSDANFLLIRSKQHQVFGYYTGEAILDSGNVIHLERIPGFAEDVQNRW
ncbi:MAG: DUF2804 domain-containing protein [Spirochaetota bacterium]